MTAYRYSIRTDVDRNVMYIDQHGRPTSADLLDLKRSFLTEVTTLRPGITVVNDQRELETLEDEAMEIAKDLVETTNRHGVARVIRIIPPDFLAAVQIMESLVEGRSRYASIRVASPEEAEEALETFLESPVR
jgi:UDP-N-acetylglucosamine transferase subunit ALG13